MRAIPPSSRLVALVLAVAVASIAVLTACGGSAAPPTVVPTPVPTPTPAPTPTPDPNVPPAGSGCGEPYPPMITRFSVKIHLKDRDWWTIDSTPLVGPNGDYCFSIGFTDGRTICPLRPEGAPDREACELWRTGRAKDTGQPGPTWTFRDPDTGQESYCTNDKDAPCMPYEGRVFSVKAIKGGLYKACSEAGACGQVDVDRNR